MEQGKYDKDEVIDLFLRGQLNKQEARAVSKQIQSDPNFKRRVKLHQLLQLGLQKRIEQEQGDIVISTNNTLAPRLSWRNPNTKLGLGIAATLLVLVLATVLVTRQTSRSDTIADLLAQTESVSLGIAGEGNSDLFTAQKAFNEQRWQEAITAFDFYLNDLKAPNFEVMLYKATALRHLGAFSEATPLLEYLITTETQHYSGNDARWQLVLVRLAQEQHDAASAQLEVLVKQGNSSMQKQAKEMLRAVRNK